METLIVPLEKRVQRSNIIWGMVFVIIGLVLVLGMWGGYLEDGFTVIHIVMTPCSALVIWAGFYSFQQNKYTKVLSADDKGIHFYVYASRIGYYKREIVLSWNEIKGISQALESCRDNEDEYEEILAIQVDFEDERPAAVIFLSDTKYEKYSPEETIADLVLKLNEMNTKHTL
ncbi:MAG: hypothetical protein FWD34_02935 [Oscillospiraceae bacterium]|nr:hypothetical protein [Oscillospiraceae bacterium]